MSDTSHDSELARQKREMAALLRHLASDVAAPADRSAMLRRAENLVAAAIQLEERVRADADLAATLVKRLRR